LLTLPQQLDAFVENEGSPVAVAGVYIFCDCGSEFVSNLPLSGRLSNCEGVRMSGPN
jgi:hypothetical protein